MTKQESVTIQDIADKANVSISTVSRVLNGNTKVGEGYKTAVLQAIEELDYRPNFFAQGLASGHSYTIGVITQNVGSPVYDAILKGILENLSQSNYSPIFADGQWDIDREEHAIETLIAKRVDGLIIVGGSTPTERLISISRQIPLIIVARIVPGLESQCIYMDNYKAGFEATQYLIDQGHRQIAHLSGIHLHQDSQERARGYQDALAQASIVINQDLIIEGDFRRQSGVMGIEMLLTKNEPFTAVFVANDQMAFGARLALFRRGIRVPDDVSLVGFDDQPDSAYMIPPLTTIRQPSVEMGIAAAKA
ncbi:MAG: LacI family DNA-binding transcriptional regulator, partial [Chloroflexota bacterium]